MILPKTNPYLVFYLLGLAAVVAGAPLANEIPAHRARQIYEAAPAKARVEPKKAWQPRAR